MTLPTRNLAAREHRAATGDRPGFTLIELLVVIGIIGIVGGLVLSSVMRARALARQTECQNNMRQVGLALLDYERQNGRLPPIGQWTGGARGWVVDLLPHLGQQTLHNQWDFTKNPWDEPNLKISDTHLPVLVCPVDPTLAPGHGNLSYVVNAGFANLSQGRAIPESYAGDRTPGQMSDAMDFNGNGYFVPSLDPDRPTDLDIMWGMGVFFVDAGIPETQRYRSHSTATMPDGADMTILLSENIHAGYVRPVTLPDVPEFVNTRPVATWATPFHVWTSFLGSSYICKDYSCAAGNVNYDNANNHSDSAMAVQAINGSRHLPDPAYFDGNTVKPTPWLSSYHSGGVNIVTCAGSVRFLSEKVSGSVFAKLITPAGKTLRGPLSQSPLSDNEF